MSAVGDAALLLFLSPGLTANNNSNRTSRSFPSHGYYLLNGLDSITWPSPVERARRDVAEADGRDRHYRPVERGDVEVVATDAGVPAVAGAVGSAILWLLARVAAGTRRPRAVDARVPRDTVVRRGEPRVERVERRLQPPEA